MGGQAPRIVVVGSSNTDMVIAGASLPRPGQTLTGGSFYRAAGGKGANQAVAAARAAGSARVAFVGAFGDDDFGRTAVRNLEDDGIDCARAVRVRGAPSGIALIFVDARGENMIAVAPGANGLLRPADVARAAGLLRRAGVVLVQLETPPATVAKALALARAAGARTILNPAPAPARPLPRGILGLVDILTPNETEFAALTGERFGGAAGARAAGRLVRSLGQALIVTLGAAGVHVYTREGEDYAVPAFTVKPVDTVGAGDAFSGALAAGLAEGMALRAAVTFAAAAAAISVTRRGAQPSLPVRREVDSFLRKARAR